MDNNQMKEVVLKAQKGDAQAFQLLFDETHNKLFLYTVGHVKEREDALDIVQETYVDLWTSLKRFQYRSHDEFMGFLFLILKRKLARHYDRQKKHSTLSLKEEIIIENDYTIPGEFDYVAGMLDELRPKYKELLQLRYWSELSFKEISEVMKVNINTSKVWHHRAMKELSQVMKKYE